MRLRLTRILDLFEVQLPILLIKPLILQLVNLVVMATAAYLSRSISPNTSLANEFGRLHQNITTQYNTPVLLISFVYLNQQKALLMEKISLIALRKASMRTLDPHRDHFLNSKDLNGQIVLQTFMELQFHPV